MSAVPHHTPVSRVPSRTIPPSGPSAGRGKASPRLALRWRWYHFYFLLALFDVAVIAASLLLYHQTLASYRVALGELATIEEEQRWVQSLRVALIDMNAPGNDIFETRHAQAEQQRFDSGRGRLEELLGRESEFGRDLSGFRRHVDAMIGEETAIFGAFREVQSAAMSDEETRRVMDRASVSMATMDRFMADGLQALAALEAESQLKGSMLLETYGAELERRAVVERFFLGVVILMLVGVFWYGRKLQRTHEKMIRDHQRAIEERHARFAAVGEVCSTVAHGIRNPLAGIRAAAQLAHQQPPGGEEQSETLADIVEAVDQLEVRVRGLLDFSRPLEPRLEDVDAGTILRRVARGIQPSAAESGVAITVEPDSESAWVRADPNLLEEVVYELAGNALRAMPGGGTLRMGAKRNKHLVALRIADAGPGIPEAVRDRVFELFYTTRAEGTGIGLASVRKMVDIQGGSVVLESAGPEGSVFRVNLPISKRSALGRS